MRVAVGGEFSIDRYEIIYSADLDAVSSVEDDCNIGVARRIFEFADRAFEIEVLDVGRRNDGVKASILEHFGHGCRVLFRIGQRGDIAIGGVANNQSNALFGKRGNRREGQK